MNKTSTNGVDFKNSGNPADPADPANPGFQEEADDVADLESLDDYHLSFEERVPKIQEICQKMFRHHRVQTTVEEPKVGGWNQVYPITITIITKKRVTAHLVLRIPCVEHDVLQTVLILRYLNSRCGKL